MRRLVRNLCLPLLLLALILPIQAQDGPTDVVPGEIAEILDEAYARPGTYTQGEYTASLDPENTKRVTIKGPAGESTKTYGSNVIKITGNGASSLVVVTQGGAFVFKLIPSGAELLKSTSNGGNVAPSGVYYLSAYQASGALCFVTWIQDDAAKTGYAPELNGSVVSFSADGVEVVKNGNCGSQLPYAEVSNVASALYLANYPASEPRDLTAGCTDVTVTASPGINLDSAECYQFTIGGVTFTAHWDDSQITWEITNLSTNETWTLVGPAEGSPVRYGVTYPDASGVPSFAIFLLE